MQLNNALGLISEKYKKPSVCESCGEEFICGATLKGCWCMEIKLSEETRQKLKENFRSCLCRNCLEKYTISKKTIIL